MKKCLIISFVLLLFLGVWTTTVSAAASVGITGPSVTTEDTVRVTVYFGENVKAAQFILNYDTSLFSFKAVSSGVKYNAGTKRAIYVNGMGDAVLSSVTFEFTPNKTGTGSFSVSGLKMTTATQTDLVPTMANTSVSTTVNPKTEPKPPVTEPDKPNGSNTGNNSGNSGSNGGNSNSNSGSTSKPNNNNSSTTTKKPTFSGGTATVYAKETVSIRDNWSTSGKLLGTLQKGKSITRTGIGSNGWDRVNYNGKVAYISGQYLTTTKPKDDDKKDDDKKDDEKKNNTTNEVSNNTVNNVASNNEIENNEEENNTINNEVNNAQTNTEQGNTEKENKGKDNKNYIEITIIGVIIAAILVIIISEILAKKKHKKKAKR